MNKAILFFFAASAIASVALAGLAGLAVNSVASSTAREVRFDIVTINPVTGQASSTQKQVFTLFTGALDINNFVVSPTGWALSLQAFDQSQASVMSNAETTNAIHQRSEWAYLARQDLNQNGRFEYCQLSAAARPINIFADTDSSVVATAVTTASTFVVVRIAFSQNSANCVTTTLGNIVGAAGIAANIKTQFNNRIFFVTEPAAGFSATAGPQIRAFDILGNQALLVPAATLQANIFPVAINALGADLVNLQGHLSAGTPGAITNVLGSFVSYDINMVTYVAATTVLTSRTITAESEQLTFQAVYNNQTNAIYAIKNVEPTATVGVNFVASPQATTLSLASATTSEVRGTTPALNTNNIFNLFILPNATMARVDVAVTPVNGIVLSGTQFLFAGLPAAALGNVNGNSVSTCRFSFSSAFPATYTSVATGSGDNVMCTLTTAPVARTTVIVEFAQDGVNYARAAVFSYAGAITQSRFARTSYNLRDATAIEAAAEKVTVEYLDAAANKVLFGAASSATLTVAATGFSAIRSATGLTANMANGIATFPNAAVDIDAAEANGVAQITLASSVGNSVATTSLNVELLRATRGTLGAIAFPTATVAGAAQVFDLHLVNPSFSIASNSSTKIGNTRPLNDVTVTDPSTTMGPALALGLNAYDRDNKVLNTVETTATGTLLLNGVSIFTTQPSNAGTGACIIPIGNGNDAPIAIWYESFLGTLNRASTFLAIVRNTDVTTNGANGAGFRLVRYTRAAASLATSTCTVALVDLLPVFDLAYGNFQIVPLSNGRIAFIEKDSFFTATSGTAAASSLLSVFRYSTVTPGNNGMWTIRNKVLSGFSIVTVTQSGLNELAISGINTAGVVTGVWLVDIASDRTAPVAPAATSLYAFTGTVNEQAVFLAGGSEASVARLRTQGSATSLSDFVGTATTLRTNVETIQLLRGATASAAARSNEFTGRNYIAFFQLEDPVITSLIPNSAALASATTILVTANHVLASTQLQCRFTSLGAINPVVQAASLRASATATSTTLATVRATANIQQDGQIVDCGALPASHSANNAYVYVQLSNDNGNNWGPEGKLAVGNVAPIISGVPVAAAATPAVGAAAVTSGQVFYEVSGEFNTSPATNQATLNALLSTTVTTALNALNQGSWSVSSPFATSNTANNAARAAYAITYSVLARSGRLAALQTSAQQLANLNAVLAANAAAFNALGATTNVRQVGTSGIADTDDNDLSQGAIAGIVIACVVGFFIIVGLIAFLVTKSKKAKASNFSQSRNYDAGAGSSSSSGSSDDDYSSYDYSSDDYSDYV